MLAEKDVLLNLFAKSFEAGAKQAWITHASFVNIALQPLACWDHNFRHMYKMYRLVASEDNPAFRALIRSLIAMLRGWVGFRRGAVLRRLEKRMKR
jgi:hypothetical protein